MAALCWDTSHAVFVTEIDDEHQEIFAAVAAIDIALDEAEPAEITRLVKLLLECIEDHFAHEERLMRAGRYDAYSWHKRKHDTARQRVAELGERVMQGDAEAGQALVQYLANWLEEHTRLADRMLGAFLRNHRRVSKVTFRAGTKPAGACAWTDIHGNPFDPETSHSGY